jgi:hypothetical protein
MKLLFIVFPVIALLSCAANASKENPAAGNIIDEAKTQEVFDRHFKAFKENNIDMIMADYADDAVLVSINGTANGKAEIKALFERVFKVFPKDSSNYETIKNVMKGDIAYTVWKCKTPKVEYQFATDTFIIQDGKIIRQTFAGH